MTKSESEKRKQDHLALCTTDEVAFKNKTTLLEQVQLVHRALPELTIADVDLSVDFCGKKLSAPIWMSAITGGTSESVAFNRSMATLAEELGIGFCLGSIKPMLRDPGRTSDFEVRDIAPTTLVMGNIGGVELATKGFHQTLEALQKIDADGLTIHLNPAQELAQPGGDTNFKGVVDAIEALIANAPDLQIVVKETGCGISFMDGVALKSAGVTKVEVGGAGGTSWVGVEALRARHGQARLGKLLWDWGIPTAVSTDWLSTQGFDVVAAGGIRDGLDVAKSLALGAKMTGLAAPLVSTYYKGGGAKMVKSMFGDIFDSLRAILLLCGVTKPEQMVEVPRVIGPQLASWISIGPSAV